MVETTTTITLILATLSLFFAAALAEISGGYLVWSWVRKKKRVIVGLVGGAILFIYGQTDNQIITTLQYYHYYHSNNKTYSF
jgi:drug/metabolite transporter superfamily protein YnfA